ncbi:MAG: cysteine--tRNA ligase [Solirubrobacterales bacterium]|nr:cysteine--tRNA ligase [Solirubrobacterales bacterium]
MREVRIRDTMSGELRSLDPGREVGIYACGPTVYSRVHIGNARPFVIFSLLARFLKSEGYETRLAINVTDINDKIYAAAAEAGVGSATLAAEMTAAYFEDTGRLGLGRPDAEPLASETIDAIVELIATLVEDGHAYESGGDVYFSVRSFDGYGKLSHRPTEEMEQGEDDSGSLKRDRLDFALWKGRKEGEDSSWDSPWGPGRPGWHIECSAMAEAELGELPFAIHGGGSDLVFPHHENEIAQSEAARGRPLAKIWMHNGMIETDAAKMSKSEGNIFQLSEALDRFGPEAVVSYLISGHYRQPLAFGAEQLNEAVARVDRLRNFLRSRDDTGQDLERADRSGTGADGAGTGLAATSVAAGALSEFRDALADDFNTPRAMSIAFDLVRRANQEEVPGAGAALAEMLELVGLGSLAAAGDDDGPPAEALELLGQREAARAERDFARADRIRDRLDELGWEVRDSADGASLVPRPGR